MPIEPDDRRLSGDITYLLHQWRAGDRRAEDRLFEIVMPDLRKIAKHYLRGERPGPSLQATVLINETYLRLVGASTVNWQDRRHFFALAARAMRRFLIDHARRRHEMVSLPSDELDLLVGVHQERAELAIAIDRVLDELESDNTDGCAMVELKFFLGLSDEEAAETLHLPLRTAQRRWREARAWLFARLEAQGWKPEQPQKTSGS